MKQKLILFALLLVSPFAFAAPSVFGMEIGKTTEAEAGRMYRLNKEQLNPYSGGYQYSLNPKSIDFSGLEQVTLIFDEKKVLVYVQAVFPKYKFEELMKMLGSKYKPVSRQIPFVGDKIVVFHDGGTRITLEGPHMSFNTTLTYAQNSLLEKYKRINQQNQNHRRAKEASML